MHDISPRFAGTKLPSYPHMFPNDVAIWNRFLDHYGREYIGFDYDIKCGTGIEPPANASPADFRLIGGTCKKRIDAIGYKDSETHLFEVKPSATFAAVGQILGYAKLYKEEFPGQPAVKLFVVTDIETPDMKNFCDHSGVALVVV